MQDLIIPVNNEAHSRALIAVVGEEQAQLVLKAYQAIDAAMVFGYAKSQAEEADKRAVMTAEYVKALQRAEARYEEVIFKDGYVAGYEDVLKAIELRQATEADFQDAFDDGYTEGVHDARVNPTEADDYINYLCELDWAEDYDHTADEDDASYFLNRDSGDESDFREPRLNAAVEGRYTDEAWEAVKDTF